MRSGGRVKMANYTLPTDYDITGFGSLAQWANSVTSGYFGLMSLYTVIILAVIYIYGYTGDVKKALVAGGYLGSLLSILMGALGIMTNFYMIGTMISFFSIIIIVMLWDRY